MEQSTPEAVPSSSKTTWVPQLVVILALGWALYPENPYGYYTLLRILCCGVFGYLAYLALTQEKTAWAWLLGGIAVLYNPIIRVHLDRDLWSAINVLTILLAGASILGLRARPARQPSP